MLLNVLMGPNHRTSLHFHSFVKAFQHLKLEVEEQFGTKINTAHPLFQRHTQLMMARYLNHASVQGTQAALPRIMDLIDIIKFRQWLQLPQLPPRYTIALGPSGGPPAPDQHALPQRGGSGGQPPSPRWEAPQAPGASPWHQQMIPSWRGSSGHPNTSMTWLRMPTCSHGVIMAPKSFAFLTSCVESVTWHATVLPCIACSPLRNSLASRSS
jgi:hypothetical protein